MMIELSENKEAIMQNLKPLHFALLAFIALNHRVVRAVDATCATNAKCNTLKQTKTDK